MEQLLLTILLTVTRSLTLERAENAQYIVLLKQVSCQAAHSHEAVTKLQDVDVELEFASDTGVYIPVLLVLTDVAYLRKLAAIKFAVCVKDMQRELMIYRLTYPLLGESIIFRRYVKCSLSYVHRVSLIIRTCGDLVVRDLFLANAEMTMLFEPCSMSHRLIIMGSTQATCMAIQREYKLGEQTEAVRSDKFDLIMLIVSDVFFRSLVGTEMSRNSIYLPVTLIEYQQQNVEISHFDIPLSTILSARHTVPNTTDLANQER